ncbi:hypothetical protein Tco_0901501 [Tanacetum coccineum]
MQVLNGLFWDMETAQLAKTVSHDKANNYLFVKVVKSSKFIEYKVYGEGDFPHNSYCCERRTEVQYRLTSSSARQKKDHIDIRIFVPSANEYLCPDKKSETRLLRNAATELASDPLGVLGCARTLVVRGVDAEADADAESSSSLLT